MLKSLGRKLGYFLIAVLLLLGAFAAFNYGKIQRLLHVNSLFDQENIIDNFQNMERDFPTHTVHRSPRASTFTYNRQDVLPPQFTSGDSVLNTAHFIDYTQTLGLMILHRDTVLLENYYLGHTDSTTNISWSVVKSMVSALVGIALEEGKFNSIEDPITQYVPELKYSGYNGLRIKDILQMSSGVRFIEDYSDYYSDINRFGRSFALGNSLDNFSASLVNERPPGTYHHYVSINTQVLGMLLKRVTGKTLAEYLEEKIWQPLQMEHDAQWIVDDEGMEVALGGLNATLRDYMRFGQLYLHEGRHGNQQLVPAEWIRQSITPDAPHLQAGDNPLSHHQLGYGFQWWLPENADGAYMAVGIYNQYIFIYPKKDLVIVKNSANYHFKDRSDLSRSQTIDFFRAISDHL